MPDENLQGHAYEELRNRIAAGVYGPGMFLSENFLSGDMGMSRTPIRSAIDRLVLEGVLERKPRIGTFVRVLEPEEWLEMYETRLCLESLATERAAVRIGEDELDGLDALVRRMESVVSVLHDSGGETLADPGAVSEMVATDIAFHRILVRAGGNRWIWKVLDGLHVFPRFFGTYRDVYSLRNLEQSVASHREIVVALRRGDAVASSVAIREHLERGREIVFAGLPVRPFSAERQWNEALDLSGPYKEFLNEIPELRKLMR